MWVPGADGLQDVGVFLTVLRPLAQKEWKSENSEDRSEITSVVLGSIRAISSLSVTVQFLLGKGNQDWFAQ